MTSQGLLFRTRVQTEPPLQVLGTINAYTALLAQKAGARAIYLSGAGVANASFGLPDLGMTNLSEVLEDARRILSVCDVPLLVDIDTGWGHAFNISRTIREMDRAGVAAVHLEDQILAKRCGHRPNKALVSKGEMCDRIKAALDGRVDEHFVVMARTDAYGVEGFEAALARAHDYVAAGADMIFIEAMASLEEYRAFTKAIHVPVLANITEFGKTPLLSRDELHAAGIRLILYPLSAFRVMAKAAEELYQTVITSGTQQSLIEKMQTRKELYEVLNYETYEKKLDQYRE